MMKMQNMVVKNMYHGAAVLVLAIMAAVAHAQNTIEAVSASVQGRVEVIRVDLAQELAISPTGFSIHSPARIAIDLPGVLSGLGRPTVDVNQGNIRSVNIVQAGDKSRLSAESKTSDELQDRGSGQKPFYFVGSGCGAGNGFCSGDCVFRKSQSGRSCNQGPGFSSGCGRSRRVIVDLANSQVGVDIKQHGQTLVVEFLKSSMPEGMRRRLDVSDFGTPVHSVTTFQAGDRVRMVIEPRGAWEKTQSV